MKNILITLILSVIALQILAQKIDKDLWLQDLNAYKTGLEQKHINLYNKISEAEFNADLELIRSSIESKTDFQVVMDLMRLTRKIGDGHTAISLSNFETHNFPFEIQQFGNDWRIVKIAKPFAHLLGTQLIAIDETPISIAAQKVGEVAQFVENQHSKIIRTAQYFPISEILFELSLINQKDKASFTFKNDDSTVFTETISVSDDDELEALSISVPEIKKPEKTLNEGFWYAPITGTDGLYIHFESYPAFEEMMQIAEEMVGYIFQNNIRELVIDLRNNGGGDLYVGLVLANALNLADPVDWQSGVYVLADKVTFSAAASNTALFRELLNAKIVGEPTGSNPTGFQDMDTFELPNSKLVVCYSKRFFRIQEEFSEGVQPDIPLQYEWESFSRGEDNMLQSVINNIHQK
ncbi:S41 family peptidase [uncultured Draconibacterium sp.]|uniref:S41 family peptidase n=1 Tax=uncultured Draconibacterium sp. TaxID=1573823 RepID=UPI002AA6FBA8|nr:S41 family peptidase [uncultured Draconibacterium sp.]